MDRRHAALLAALLTAGALPAAAQAKDTDRDGMSDRYERQHRLDPQSKVGARKDTDKDGLSNLRESRHNIDPRRKDTDRDRMRDGFEVKYRLKPRDKRDAAKDADRDGVTNLQEALRRINPRSGDSDRDGMSDGFEVSYRLNPRDKRDAAKDADGDGLTNLQEAKGSTSPRKVDTDGDGTADGKKPSAQPKPDQPAAQPKANQKPAAAARQVETDEDTAVEITLAGTDADGDALTFAIATDPEHGSLSFDGTAVSYTPDADHHGSDSFTYTATDSHGATSEAATVGIDVAAVNDAPSATDAQYSTDEDTELFVAAPGLLAHADDVDGDELTASQGVLARVPLAPPFSVSADGAFTYDPVGRFDALAKDESDEVSVPFQVTDPDGETALADAIVTITGVNDAPTVVNPTAAAAYVEDGDSVSPLADAEVGDVDSADLTGATVKITDGADAGDHLSFQAPNGITGDYDAQTRTLTLEGSASQADYQSALASVTYSTTSDTPSESDRTLDVTVNDGTVDSTVATATVGVTATDDALTAAPATGTVAFNEGQQGGTPVFAGIELTDPDGAPTLDEAVVSFIDNSYHAGEDELTFDSTMADEVGINVLVEGGTVTLTKGSGIGTLDHYMGVLSSIRYTNTAATPNEASRTVRLTLRESGSLMAFDAATRTITVTAQAAPVVAFAGEQSSFSEADGTAVQVNPGLTVSDADSTHVKEAVITLTDAKPGDELSVDASGTDVTVYAYNPLTGVLRLAGNDLGGNDTKEHFEQILKSLKFDTSNEDPGTERTVSFVLTDAEGNSSTAATRKLTVVASNDAPTPSPDTASAVIGGPALTSFSLLANDSDPDGTQEDLTVTDVVDSDGVHHAPGTEFVSPKGATVTFQAGGGYSYLPSSTPGNAGSDVFTYTVSDPQGATATSTLTVTVDEAV